MVLEIACTSPTQKAKEGVSVRILYDDIGSRSLSLKNFTDIKEHGGLVEAFSLVNYL